MGEEDESTEPEPVTTADTEDTDVDDTAAGHTPWPETPEADIGHDATEPDDEPADLEFGGGITPETPENDRNGSEAGASAQDDEGQQPTGGGTSSPRPTPESNIDLERSTREANLEFACPECGLTREVGNSSMRAGDICPDCRQGYITEREQ
jgi:predicted RNA-binding Zn-ribbon protein involved in translation (DUF1610 family)